MTPGSGRRVGRRWPWMAALASVLLGVALVLGWASQDRRRAEREEALFRAIEAGDDARALALLDSGVSVNARRLSNPAPPWQPLQDLQTRWEYPDYPFQIGYTPLMTASIRGDAWMVARLLDRGADIRAVESEGSRPTALEFAISYRHPAVARLLLDRGAPPDGAPGSYGPLHTAWQDHDWAMVRLLLRRGATPLPPALKKPVIPRL